MTARDKCHFVCVFLLAEITQFFKLNYEQDRFIPWLKVQVLTLRYSDLLYIYQHILFSLMVPGNWWEPKQFFYHK